MNNQLPLSVAVITLNEERRLPRCLKSIRDLAAEIVVIDSGSQDGTRKVAERFGAVFEFHPWSGFVAQREVALRRCTQPWVLCLDADEAVSPQLADAIDRALGRGDTQENGYQVNRLNFYLGRWIRHSWYPEWRLRLVRREAARSQGIEPHDKLEVTGPIGRLSGHLEHYSFDSVQDHLIKSVSYARIMADSYARAGRSVSWYQAVFSPWAAFLKILVLKSGWRDGWRGWVIAGAKWLNVFAKYAFLLERRWPKPDPDRQP